MSEETTQYKKPLPRPPEPELTAPFWEAAKRHELILCLLYTSDAADE